MLLTIITALFLQAYAVLIFFYYKEWQKLRNFSSSEINTRTFVSVVIAARNEEKNLPQLIKNLELQDYPKDSFEVIVVDDFSTDNTFSCTKSAAIQLKIVQPEVEPHTSSKKVVIAYGISQARGELILITDADCKVQPKWISTVVNFYSETGAHFIAAPVKYEHNGSLFQVFQTLDFITLQGITAASVASGFHNMCNGANLAYTKEAFKNVNGFEGIDKVATGDDMLLMHKIDKQAPGKVFYLKNEDAIVSTSPMLNLKDFLMQRRRWASKTLVYEDFKIIGVLAFVLAFNLLFFVLLFFAYIHTFYWFHVVIFLILKFLIEYPFVASVAGFYNEKRLMRYFFVFQPLHIFYTCFVGIISQFGKYEWKGRKTR